MVMNFARIIAVVLLICAAQVALSQQIAVATGGVNVRAARSASSSIREHLAEGETATLVSPTASGGYYHVKIAGGITGYAWAARIAIVGSPAPLTAAAAEIKSSWKTTGTNASSYEWPDTHTSCAAEGKGTPGHTDPETNSWKNRDDEPASYHDVAWDAIMALEVPRDSTKYRANWSSTDKATLAKYEGIPVRVVAYLSGAKKESGESANCGDTAAGHVDWHLYMTKAPKRPKTDAIVIESTPRVRFNPKHASWTYSGFAALAKSTDSVRVSGWLMFDPAHWDQMYRYDPHNATKTNKYRATLWEIHPITDLEVWRGGKWVSLDKP
jgi:hypothetical protein